MDRYICIHGHFYQPPRENAWLEAIECQDSAYPYHDWNERITAECYGPNGFARILNGHGNIASISNNYSKISFNFGATLLSWMDDNAPDAYGAILNADKIAQKRFSGHGSAMAQGYNHLIMPLANTRDKYTQVLWGIRDFEHRFGRVPEGLWLPETAVDLETLDIMADLGVLFTILSPYQAKAIRPIGDDRWHDVGGGRIDPTRAYLQMLPSGRSINLFFYDGPISHSVAFEKLLVKGDRLASRLVGGFSNERNWPQLVHIATDGESYGHHHRYGEMALAYALHHIETHKSAKLTNYGEFLARHPATHEVQIYENTAWSCAHGVERWRSNCGCNSGRSDWHQNWRAPLREALDWLQNAVATPFEKHANEYVHNAWKARDDYVQVILDRNSASIQRFVQKHSKRTLDAHEIETLLRLMEMQRHAMLMYTSCGWFFDDLSGIETVQIIQYAGRVIQLAQKIFQEDWESAFLDLLERAPSNVPEYGNGRKVYEKKVKPAMVDWSKIAAHYAVSSLFERYQHHAQVFCFDALQEDFREFEAGKARMVIGRVRLRSQITLGQTAYEFSALHFGDHNINSGVREFRDERGYHTLVRDLYAAFSKADFPEIIRLMTRAFGDATYSLRSIFSDEQRKLTQHVLEPTLNDVSEVYQRMYEQHLPTMRYLADLGVPLPHAFQNVTQFILNKQIRETYQTEKPDAEKIYQLLDEAEAWHVSLDQEGLAYHIKQRLEVLNNRLRDFPDDVERIMELEWFIVLVNALPFGVDLWLPQNGYFELLRKVYPLYEAKALQKDEAALEWVERFLSLGDKLNMQVSEQRHKLDEFKKAPTIEQIVADALQQRRIPRATYRLQFCGQFSFQDGRDVVPYLNDLGVSDCYASPILQARPNSPHGYDICDHSRLNAELGDEQAFTEMTDALRHRGMGLILDVVPNHMGIGHQTNRWWMDVLENGPSSIYAPFFDIDWDPVNPNLKNKLLLPLLEDQYGVVLESGLIRLAYENGAFFFMYHDNRLPVTPRSYIDLLQYRLEELTHELGRESRDVQELQSIITALNYLPDRDAGLTAEKIEERNREKEIIKRRIATLAEECADFRSVLETVVETYNGRVGDAHSFDLLDELLEIQPYRLAFWRVAGEEINYRRFFDINELAAIRVERPDVFRATHQLVLRLMAEGKVTALRIDHPDGLWDPASYFHQLQESYLVQKVATVLGPDKTPQGVEKQVHDTLTELLEDQTASPTPWPVYVVAEKILGDEEPLPANWAVEGTTGYDFMNAVNGLFVNGEHVEAFDAIYKRFANQKDDIPTLVVQCQKIIMLVSMASEVASLGHQLDRISERNRRYRDFTLNSLTFALREIIASLSIYRTYITSSEPPSLRDRVFLENAVEMAKEMNPRTATALFDFIRDVLLLRNLSDFLDEERPVILDWVMRFQQVTGPVLAKGLEDTAFYRYNRLVSLNEVGGHPEHFGVSLEDFHRANENRRQFWPHAMLATATHDTKRSEDMRARLNVLSEIPHEWEQAVFRWAEMNSEFKTTVEKKPAPSANDEYLLYQSLIGVWPTEPVTEKTLPELRTRVVEYIGKAIHEAKTHTSWVNPNAAYDQATSRFVERAMERLDSPFLSDLVALQKRVAYFGYYNALSQVLLKIMSPGVPDFYQGTELWHFALVDPDNRRPVDFHRHRLMLADLKERIDETGEDLTPLTQRLLADVADGEIKMYLTYRALQFRREHFDLFTSGFYVSLEAQGHKANHVCSFARQWQSQTAIAVAPRLVVGLTDGQEQPPMGATAWGETTIVLADAVEPRPFRDLFTGHVITPVEQDGRSCLRMADVLRHFPVALLVAE